MTLKNQSYIVRVYINAENAEKATQAVATAMLGKGYSWQILESETTLAPDGLAPQDRLIKAHVETFNKLIDTIAPMD